MGDGVDIAAWLRELGLERYEQKFRESDVDTDILADLTETDLEELGISLSHRKKLLNAIAALSSQECSGAVEPTASYLGAQQPGELVKFQAERRQLTVLFCDLVGSTDSGGARSRGYGRGDPRLSAMLQKRDWSLGRARRQMHRRRCARLLRLASGP